MTKNITLALMLSVLCALSFGLNASTAQDPKPSNELYLIDGLTKDSNQEQELVRAKQKMNSSG